MKTLVILNLVFRSADDPQLRRLLLLLKSSINILTTRQVRTDLQNHASEIREEISTLFAQNEAKISLALDAWISLNHLAFLDVLSYIIIKNWKYEEVLLAVDELFSQHIDSRLADTLLEILNRFDIKNKFFDITTDNVSNNKILTATLTTLLKDRDESSDEVTSILRTVVDDIAV